MQLIAAILAGVLFVMVLKRAIKVCPSAFYGIAFAMVSVSLAILFLVSLVLVILLMGLPVALSRFIRKWMSASRWKRLQMLAYPFFILIYAHLMLILLSSIASFDRKAWASAGVCPMIMVSYAVFRIRMYAVAGRQEKKIGGEGLQGVVIHEGLQ